MCSRERVQAGFMLALPYSGAWGWSCRAGGGSSVIDMPYEK